MRVRAHAPGRVNLIGDHTDYAGGLVLPMAIDRGATVVLERSGHRVVLESADEESPAVVDLDVSDPADVTPPWARFVAGVVREIRPSEGGVGKVHSDLAIGAGLASSAALEVALALALGFEGSPLQLALACQRAEQAASGVPCGMMDQLASAAGEEGCALLIDCSALSVTPVPLPDGVDVVVVHSGQQRSLSGSAYAERREQCEAAAAIVGPLRDADLDDVATIEDPMLRRRARHVVSENARVTAFASALAAEDLAGAGALMVESHRSLHDDFEVSTTALDELVVRLLGQPGVHGARLTGAGFGGCVVALADPGALAEGWLVSASGPARVVTEAP
ncbi:MAG TPA: galactokinase [Acidimicrobiales bacterium]|nr:galactokinase [Acidimicrobiales bacterium]